MERIIKIHKVDSTFKPRTESARLFLQRLQKAEIERLDECDVIPEDPLFHKKQYVPSKENGYKVTGFIYKGDVENGLMSKPPIWLYRYRRCLIRLRFCSPEVPEEIMLFGEDAIYEMTNDAMARSSVSLENFTRCQLQFEHSGRGQGMKKFIKVVSPEELQEPLKHSFNEKLAKYPSYVKNTGRFDIQPFAREDEEEKIVIISSGDEM